MAMKRLPSGGASVACKLSPEMRTPLKWSCYNSISHAANGGHLVLNRGYLEGLGISCCYMEDPKHGNKESIADNNVLGNINGAPFSP